MIPKEWGDWNASTTFAFNCWSITVLSVCLSLSHTHTHTHTRFRLSVSLSLSHTHTGCPEQSCEISCSDLVSITCSERLVWWPTHCHCVYGKLSSDSEDKALRKKKASIVIHACYNCGDSCYNVDKAFQPRLWPPRVFLEKSFDNREDFLAPYLCGNQQHYLYFGLGLKVVCSDLVMLSPQVPLPGLIRPCGEWSLVSYTLVSFKIHSTLNRSFFLVC